MRERPIRVPESYPLVQDPPFSLKTEAILVAVPASEDALRALCERTFAWTGLGIQPIGGTVLMAFLDVIDARTGDATLGSFSYREMVVFVPVRGVRDGHPFAALHVPFIYPTEGLAIASGREVYGLPKKPASITLPAPTQFFDGSPIAMECLAAERFDGSPWRERTLLRVEADAHTPSVEVPGALLDAIDVALGGPFGPELGLVGRLFEQTLLQCKQVADVDPGSPPRVLDRSLVEIPAPVRAISNVRLADPSRVRVRPFELASEPLREVLGLGSTVVASFAASASIEFAFEPGQTLLRAADGDVSRKERVLILGGGLGGLCTALALTSTDRGRARYDVRLVSQGHYLGGKAANLRGEASEGRRVEEHGIHAFFGFYHNALKMMRGVYAEAGRRLEPSTFEEAFTPSSTLIFNDGRGRFDLVFPRTPAGYGAGPKSIEQQLEVVLELVRSAGGFGTGSGLKEMLYALAARFVGIDAGNRVAAEVLAFALTLVRGVTEDVVLRGRTWLELDAQDFREWMESHRIPGFPDLRATAVMQIPYDGVFAYEGPDTSRPRLSAGVAARGLIKLIADYERAPLWCMNAGMGEAVIRPMLEVLRARGVRVEFFTRVNELRMLGGRAHEVVVARQAKVRGGADQYDPFEQVGALGTWRRRPDAAQLDLDAVGSEDPMSDAFHGQVGPDEVLREGVDFDWVVCALPAPATAHVLRGHTGQPTLEAIGRIPTVATLHAQLWFRSSVPSLGWASSARVLGGFPQPLNTMLLAEEVLATEAWPSPTPRGLLYLSGPFGGGWATDSTLPVERDAARTSARTEVRRHIETHLPAALPGTAASDGSFDPRVLYAAGGDPFDAQYVRGNIDRSERYVLMAPGTLSLRPFAVPTELSNLRFAGDWVRTGIDIPCVEGTVVSALQAANGILPPSEQLDVLW